jgi:site-specific recombinase XerD
MTSVAELLPNHPMLAQIAEDARAQFLHDHQLVHAFLWSYRGSQATFNAYRRDIERLLHWCWLVQNISICKLDRAMIEAYVDFCRKPPLSWIGTAHKPRYVRVLGEWIPNSDWRPFVAQDKKSHALSPIALSALLAVLSTFFQFLIAENAASMNPVALIRQKSKYVRRVQLQKVHRRLSKMQWSYVLETAELMAAEDPDRHHRTLFMMHILYGLYLRISELAASERWTPQMGHFHQDHHGDWWFTTVGKGNKMREISVSLSMLQALRRYRISRKLTPLPTANENTPLIATLNHGGPVTGTRHIRKLVQACFDYTIDRMRAEKLDEDADALSAATVHWLRHTGISDDVEHRPREHVRDDAGHSSSITTDRYIDISTRERAQSARHKKLIPD